MKKNPKAKTVINQFFKIIFIEKKLVGILKRRKESTNKTIINNSTVVSKLSPVNNEETAQALKTLSENGLHGKLATAQLHAKTLKIEQGMSEIERQKVFYFF